MQSEVSCSEEPGTKGMELCVPDIQLPVVITEPHFAGTTCRSELASKWLIREQIIPCSAPRSM